MIVYKTHSQVLSHHCDASGVVHFPRYSEMAQEVMERWFDEALDWSFGQMRGGEDLGVLVVGAQIEFRAASRAGEHLIWRLTVGSIGRSSVGLAMSATCGGEERVSMTLSVVLSEIGFNRPHAWPSAIRARMGDYIIELAAD